MIKLEKLSKAYETDGVETPVLFDVDLKIDSGEFVAIMGPSGSGKSTLMQILGFLDRPSTGKYFFDGKDTASFSDDELAALRNARLGFIFQAFNLLPRTTVLENVKLPLQYSPMTKEKDKDGLATEALKSVGLEHRINFLSNQLSGGEKQRVAIARALVLKPKVIFADEPTGNLDSKSGSQVMEILDQLNEQGHTIILVTHESNTARFAKRIISISDGRIVKDEQVVTRKQYTGELK